MKFHITTLIALSLSSSMAFAAGDFEFNDTNKDGNLDRNEYYGSMADASIFSDWDLDNDSLLSEDEFDEIGSDYDFDTWDLDDNNYLDAAEVYDGYYNAYDEDEDGHWNPTEWDDAGDEGFFDI